MSALFGRRNQSRKYGPAIQTAMLTLISRSNQVSTAKTLAMAMVTRICVLVFMIAPFGAGCAVVRQWFIFVRDSVAIRPPNIYYCNSIFVVISISEYTFACFIKSMSCRFIKYLSKKATTITFIISIVLSPSIVPRRKLMEGTG